MLLASYLAHVEEWHGGKARMQAVQKRITRTLGRLKMDFGTFAGIAISKAIAEAEERGSIECVYAPPALSPKLATRLHALDKALELQGGIANAVLGDLMRDFMDGEASVIHGSWTLGKNAPRCHREFFRLVDGWRAEDGLPRLPQSKRSLFAWTGAAKVKPFTPIVLSELSPKRRAALFKRSHVAPVTLEKFNGEPSIILDKGEVKVDLAAGMEEGIAEKFAARAASHGLSPEGYLRKLIEDDKKGGAA